MFDWIGDFFKELLSLIPKVIYLLNTSLLSLIDFLQLLFRKLAGLDIYYVDGQPMSGDLLTNFIGGILGININSGNATGLTDYSLLSTVFWSFVIFGLIILFISTIVAIIKSHYTYNEKSAKGPLPIVATAGKAIINMIAVPIIVILGLYLSQAILTALDEITAVGSDDLSNLYGQSEEGEEAYGIDQLQQGVTDSAGNQTYIFYDMFGHTGQILYGLGLFDRPTATIEEMSKVAARTQPFSGAMFKVAAYNGNRVRKGQYSINTPFTGNGGGGLNLFTQHNNDDDVLANMVDEAFANFLHLNGYYEMVYGVGDLECERYLTNFTTTRACAFSKFNVGLVWYYYDLWDYNFIVGFGACIVCLSIFLNIIMGLMSRLIMSVVLFLVMPPLAGLAPIDDGKAFKGWRENFMKQVLMAYGAVVGMNLVLLILPYINEINFFGIVLVDRLVQTLFIIVGLITIKAVISTLSGLIGAADANKTGDDMSKEVKSTIGKATAMTVGAAGLGALPYTAAMKAPLSLLPKGAKEGLDKAVGAARDYGQAFLSGGFGGALNERRRRSAQSKLKKANDAYGNAQIANALEGINDSTSENDMRMILRERGLDENQINQISKVRAGMAGSYNADDLSREYANKNRSYQKFVNDNGGTRAAAANTIGDKGIKVQDQQTRLDIANQNVEYYKRHPGLLGGTFRGVSNVAKTTMGIAGVAYGGAFDKDTMDAFNDTMVKAGVRPKGPDWAKASAENTAKTNAAINELTQEIRRMNRR